MKKKLLIIAVVTFIVGAIAYSFNDVNRTVYIDEVEVEEVVVLDHFDKLTNNLNEKMRKEAESTATVARAEEAYREAVKLNDFDREELNKAVEAINTYQGM